MIILTRGTIVCVLYGGGSVPAYSFAMNVYGKDDAYKLFQSLGTQVSRNIGGGVEMQQLGRKDFQHRKKYYKKCSDYICGAKEYIDYTMGIQRDQVTLTNVFNSKLQPCIYPSFCFPICWIGNVCPRLCCCFLNFCSVVEKKEDTTVLYLKNVSQYDTNQGFCNCNMLSRSEQHYVIFRFSNKIGYCARREDVTEAVRLLDNYTSGIQNISMQQNIQLNNNMVPPTRSGNEYTFQNPLNVPVTSASTLIRIADNEIDNEEEDEADNNNAAGNAKEQVEDTTEDAEELIDEEKEKNEEKKLKKVDTSDQAQTPSKDKSTPSDFSLPNSRTRRNSRRSKKTQNSTILI